MTRPDWVREIEKLRKFRAPPARDSSIAPGVEGLEKSIKRARKVVGGLDGVWSRVLPPLLAEQTSPVKLTPGGTLTIRAANAAAAYELNQWLRAGGDLELKRHCAATVRRISIL